MTIEIQTWWCDFIHCNLQCPECNNQDIHGDVRKDNMLSTIVLTLLAIWLSIMIIGQLIGGVVGYKFFKSITSENEDK